MNTFIATFDERTIAVVNDDILRGTVVNDLVIACLRNGLQVHYADEPAPNVPVVQIQHPKPKQIAPPKRHYKRRKTSVKPASASEFNEGDHVYLAWSNLNDKLKLEMSQYRMTAGVVEDFRSGLGVQKTIGVRFNSDPELTWLRASELARSAGIDQ
jgi:hypothetical protein